MNGQNIGGGVTDRIIKETSKEVGAMQERFRVETESSGSKRT